MFGTITFFAITGADVGRKMLGVWTSIGVCLPIFWIFGEPLSGAGKRSEDKP